MHALGVPSGHRAVKTVSILWHPLYLSKAALSLSKRGFGHACSCVQGSCFCLVACQQTPAVSRAAKVTCGMG